MGKSKRFIERILLSLGIILIALLIPIDKSLIVKSEFHLATDEYLPVVNYAGTETSLDY